MRGDGKGVLTAALRGGAGLGTDFVAEEVDFVDDELFHAFDGVFFFEVEVEGRGADGLVRWIMPNRKVRVFKRLLASNSFGGIEVQHLREQVDGLRVSLREELLERNSGPDGKRANVVLSPGGADPPQSVLRGSTEVVQDLVQLIDIVPAFEDRLACQKLCENAANTPHVDGRCVVCKTQHNFGSAVPPGGHVLGHEPLPLLLVEATRETEVTDLKLAVGIHQEISWLKVAVKNVSRVDVLEATKGLVNERLEVGVGQRLSGSNDSVQISLHEFFIKIDFVEVPTRIEDNIHVIEASDVLVPPEMMK